MHWILLLFMDYHGTAMMKVEGFSSKETCEYAASQIDVERYYNRVGKYCIEVK